MNEDLPEPAAPSREIANASLFAADISFSDTEKILFTEDLQEGAVPEQDVLMDGNPAERYTIVRPLNKGGMKSIWEVDDHRTARKVAMAIIEESKIASERDIEAFLYEARLTANLQHPNIIPIYDIALDENGNPYFTMKALKGQTLGEILKQQREGVGNRKYTRTRLLNVFLKVCNAMAYAHSKGVLHLDLKPSNVIVGEFGDVHVLDWGLSTLMAHLSDESNDSHAVWHSVDDVSLESGQTLTRYLESTASDRKKRNLIGGTPGYMAPEQAKASPGDIDFRTDIYMLGAMLYEILTLHHAVEGDCIQDVLKKTVQGVVIPPGQHRAKIPTAIAAIAMKALSAVKEDRYATVSALIRDVHQFQDGFATEAENPTFVTHLTLLMKRHKRPVCLIAIFVVLLILVIFNAMRSIKASEQEAIAARKVATERLAELKAKDEYIRQTARKVAPDYLALFASEEADFRFEQAALALDTSLAFDSGMEMARFNKAVVLVCQQRFKEAQAFLPPVHPLYRLAAQSRAPLSEERIPSFVEELGKITPDALGRFFYHLNQQPVKDVNARIQTLQQVLEALNPSAVEIALRAELLDDGLWSVQVSAKSVLESLIPFIGLPLESLDLSGVQAPDLTWIKGGRVKHLDLSDSDLNHLQITDALRQLESLNISGTHIRNLNAVLKLARLRSLNISGIEGVNIPPALIFNQNLKVLTVSRAYQFDETVRLLGSRGIIVLYDE